MPPENDTDHLPAALQFRIDLEGFKPPIWRRVIVPGDATFADVHEVIQAVFEWRGSHLHDFDVNDQRIGPPQVGGGGAFGLLGTGGDVHDEARIPAAELLVEERDWCRYTYDFGDSWRHKVRLEEVLDEPPDERLPVCVKGRRPVPREDSRGLGDLEAMVGGDPDAFDLEAVDATLEPLRQRRKRREGDRSPPGGSVPATTLVWTPQRPRTCVACGDALYESGLGLEVRVDDGDAFRRWLVTEACRECKTHHASVDELVGYLADEVVQPQDVAGFGARGSRLETYVQVASPFQALERGPTGKVGVPIADIARAPLAPPWRGVDADEGLPWSDYRGLQRARTEEVPEPVAWSELPESASPWRVRVGSLGYNQSRFGDTGIRFASLVVDADDRVRAHASHRSRRPDAGELARVVRRAASSPEPPCDPGRPERLVLGDGVKVEVDELAAELSDGSPEVEGTSGDGVGPWLENAHDDPRAGAFPPVLSDGPSADLHRFFDAGRAFFQAEPWTRLDPEDVLGLRVGDRDWRFVSVKGEEGIPPGVAIFASKGEAEAFVDRSDDPPPPGEGRVVEDLTRGIEAADLLMAAPRSKLNPLDAARLHAEEVFGENETLLLVPARLTSEGLSAPERDIREFALVLEALAEGVPELGEDGTWSGTVDGQDTRLEIPAGKP